MKLATHYIFTIGLVALAARAIPIWTYMGGLGAMLAVAVWLGLATNYVIDKGGHEVRNGVRRRTAATHSLPGALGIGAAVGVVPALILLLLIESGSGTSVGISLGAAAALALIMAGLGAIAGLSHLFLDALTEGGIYYHGHRWALAHWRYDNPGANALFALLGLLALGAAVSAL